MGTHWSPDALGDLSGRVALVTGANSGIGFEAARELAIHGAHVVLACRNEKKGQDALARIEGERPTGAVELMALDLSSLASIEGFASAYAGTHGRLDMLINNAGVMVPPLTRTEDGFELQFGTNHLGHFALTGHLLPCLQRTPGARVVNVASLAHRFGRIDFDNLNAERSYSRWGFYGQSKLANLLFTRALQRRLRANGDDIKVTAAHPGYSATNLQNNLGPLRRANGVFAQAAGVGAWPTLRAAVDPAAEDAGYYGPAHRFELVGPPVPVKRSRRAQDDAVAARLWAVSEELTGVRYLSTAGDTRTEP
jgi:NAD(P)-dependent dehydrogenase (short-subunit alcohol dehydrogenase family)